MAQRTFRYIGNVPKVINGTTRQPNELFGPVDDTLPAYTSEIPKGTLLEDKPNPATPGIVQDGGTAFAIAAGAWNQVATGGAAGGAQNATGFRILLVVRAGVAADPGQNGHIYLEIAPDNNAGALPTTGWITTDYVAHRNNQAAGSGGAKGVPADNLLGSGKGLIAFVPKGWWYRLRTFVVPSYAAPQWITDGANAGFFQTIQT